MAKKGSRPKKNRSIMTKILIPMTLVFMMQTAIFLSAVFLSGTFDKMRYNKRTAFYNQTNLRISSIESTAANRWMNVEYTYDKIITAAETLFAEQNLTAKEFMELEDDALKELSTRLINDVAVTVADSMRISYSTGSFVVFGENALANRYGLYLRDNDPDTNTADNSDLTIEVAPMEFESGPMISSSYRKFKFSFQSENETWSEFFTRPLFTYTELSKDQSDISYAQCGWWSPLRTFINQSVKVSSYSVPLIAKDGTVFGVYGIDIAETLFKKLLPFYELNDQNEGTYLLSLANTTGYFSEPNAIIAGFGGDEFFTQAKRSDMTYSATDAENVYTIQTGQEKYCLAVKQIRLYENGLPFSDEQWVLFAVIDEDILFEEIGSIFSTIIRFLVLAFLVAILIAALVSYLISRPITALTKKIKDTAAVPVLKFTPTAIKEIDNLTGAIEQLSSRVFEANMKLEKTIALTGMPVASFEYDVESGYLFMTENFGDVFGIAQHPPFKEFSLADFSDFLDKMEPRVIQTQELPDDEQSLIVYKFEDDDGNTRWVEMRRVKQDDGRRVLGIVNNVTSSYREKETLIFERNFDVLCGIYNRRSFSENIEKLFERGNLGIGAFMMFDIDNLKYINDNYGHDFGDRYIQSAAQCLVAECKKLPRKIYGRRSGDEFYAFIYGYDSVEAVKKDVKQIYLAFKNGFVTVPGGDNIRVRISGGVSLFPQDSQSHEQLMRFADFAMYEIKTTAKGELAYYDSNTYLKNSFLLGSKEDLFNLLENELVEFHYQPIVSLQTGEIYGYETLMRSLLPIFKSPQDIFNVAQFHYRLGQLEKLTFFKGIRDFEALRMPPSVRLFINSVPSQDLKDEEWRELKDKYSRDFQHIVVEFTEYERASYNAMQHKLNHIRDCGARIALDDYGTGYNGEAVLLEFFPDFIKIDMLLVRNVNKDNERQKIISNLVSFAKERKMLCIAEGVETQEELETVIRLGCDFVQGYYIAKPAKNPPLVPDAARRKIVEFYQKYFGTPPRDKRV
ncbi:MAG: bifunctional diguanylate cyclase/phosphodiesterase [Firmicutes bacterium]|nr:bifunctional diguanylate cyclase/phosphodiesterase [Bacillota bacterium]